jgi:hypothetical protein
MPPLVVGVFVSDIKIQKELVVGYHGECLDGSVAAFAAYECYGDSAEYRPLLHRNPPPADLEGRDFILLDFAYSSRIVAEFRAKSTTILDHHDTLIDDLREKPGVLIDLDRSGAGIAWDQLHPAEKRPRLVNYVEDDDLGRWNLPWSKEVRCFLGIVHAETAVNDFAAWQELREEMETGPGFQNLVEKGRDMYAHKLAEVKRIIQQTSEFIKLHDQIVPAVNSVNCVDDICEHFGPKYPFAVVWHGIPGGRYKYSLRTCRDDVHVGEIAKTFGGGGRQRAAAFYSEHAVFQLPGVKRI